jgi:hypothetical protein
MTGRESIDMKGRLTIHLENEAGEIVQSLAADNAIVLTGRDLVAQLFTGISKPNPISHIAIGTGTTPVNDTTDKTLETEVFRKAIQPITLEHITTVGNRQRVFVSADITFKEAVDQLLTEAGIFNAAEGGLMYNRVVFPPLKKTDSMKLTLVWEILF